MSQKRAIMGSILLAVDLFCLLGENMLHILNNIEDKDFDSGVYPILGPE